MASIAIVGMACEYPGARSPDELWENVLAGRRAFRRIPPERLSLDDYFSDDHAVADAIYVSEAAVIDGYEFDRARFRVAGSTYRAVDPAHWLALDVACRALVDAGFPDGDGLPRETTGVLVGNTLTGEFSRAALMRLRWPYVRRVVDAVLREAGQTDHDRALRLARMEEVYKAPFPAVGEETLAGGLSNTIAGRICNHLDLMGGGYTVDGACASSLLAVATACSSLAGGDTDVVLAGGVDLSLDPFELVGFAKVGAMASGDMRVFDTRSDGFLPGEGCGFVVLMREDDAIAQHRLIKAVVRGWGVSSDGSGGITRPEFDGQLLAIRRAYRRASFDADTVAYVEAHGTGTSLGDLTELRVLAHATGHLRHDATPVAVSSVKANIGHTKAAAGVAGVIKAVRALQSQLIPPTTACDIPHPIFRNEASSLRVPQTPEMWPADRALRAGVSAMGFGGINTHVVLESAITERKKSLTSRERSLQSSAQDCELVLLGGTNPDGLLQQVERLRDVAGGLSRAELTDLAVALQRVDAETSCRAAVVASTPTELAQRLEALRTLIVEGGDDRIDAAQGLFLGTHRKPPCIGFLFPGQGSPVCADGGIMGRCFDAVCQVYGGWPPVDRSAALSTAVAQPAIVAASLAGLRVLTALGIEGTVAVGHSLGELTALHWGGAFDESALRRIVVRRGELMAEASATGGAMVGVAIGPDEVEPLIARTSVVVASLNTPRQSVLSGAPRDVASVAARARAAGIRATPLPVSCAFHSPLMATAALPFAQSIESESWCPLERPVVSTVTGHWLTPDEDLRDLLVRQLTAPVRFSEAVTRAASGLDLLVEVGPGEVLAGLVADFVRVPVIALDVGGRSMRGLLMTVGAAFVLGASIRREALTGHRFVRPFETDRRRTFFANPCEEAPTTPSATPSRTRRRLAAIETPSGHLSVSATGVRLPAIEVVRQLVATRAELPPSSVLDGHRLLSDLHLNSISVSQIVAEAARQLTAPVPVSPAEYADATITQVADALEESKRLGRPEQGEAASRQPPGVEPWVRAFSIEQQEQPLRSRVPTAPPGIWQVFAADRSPLRVALEARCAVAPGNGVVVCLGEQMQEKQAPAILLEAARAALAASRPARFIVVQHGQGGSGFARSLHLEAPEITTVVVNVPIDGHDVADWVMAEALAAEGMVEVFRDDRGARRIPLLRHLPLPAADTQAAIPLGPADVMLVTGGGKGIAAECALSVARACGVRLGLVGRSDPASDEGLAANLERLRAAGVSFEYLEADVSDAAAVRRAVQRAEASLGPVAAVLHAAGTNVPAMIGALDEEALHAALDSKVRGLDNVLRALTHRHLRLLVSFGSIIARTGLRGEAHYALANELLRNQTDRFQSEHPACRCVTLEWSVWAGTGMGQRLGRLETLAQQGISPISMSDGTAILKALLQQRALPPAVVVTGRLPDLPGLVVEDRELPLHRFLEHPRVHYPGIELVSEVDVSSESDPYVDDHVLEGARLFPAVMVLEAMSQVGMAAANWHEPPMFENVAFLQPLVVPEQRKVRLRIAALVRAPDRVDVTVRSESTGFLVDHCRATCRRIVEALPVDDDLQSLWRSDCESGAVALDPERDLYGTLLFHGGQFRRLRRYRRLTANESVADVAVRNEDWFGRYLPSDLVLGDPGARDAAIHSIQPCVPHARLLPVSVDRIAPLAPLPAPHARVIARERHEANGLFVYDLSTFDEKGTLREHWSGLRLRTVESLPNPGPWNVALLGPYLERRLRELCPGARLSVLLEQGSGIDDRPGRGDRVIRRLLRSDGPVFRRPDGKPETFGTDAPDVSVSYAGDLVLAVAGPAPVGCDMETVGVSSNELEWESLLGPLFELSTVLQELPNECRETAFARIWTARECLRKSGSAADAALVVDTVDGRGGIVLRSGSLVIGTFVVQIASVSAPLALALLTRSEM